MKSKLKSISKSGLSLIEAVITIFIVGMVLMLYTAAVGTIRLVRTSQHQETALRAANNKIDELRSVTYENLPSSGSFTSLEISALPNGSGEMNISDFNTSTKEIVVTVQWTEHGSLAARNVSLTTLVTETGGL